MVTGVNHTDFPAILELRWPQFGYVVRIVGLENREEVSSLGEFFQGTLEWRLSQWQHTGWGGAIDEDGEFQGQLLDSGERILQDVPNHQLCGKSGTLRVAQDAIEWAVVYQSLA